MIFNTQRANPNKKDLQWYIVLRFWHTSKCCYLLRELQQSLHPIWFIVDSTTNISQLRYGSVKAHIAIDMDIFNCHQHVLLVIKEALTSSATYLVHNWQRGISLKLAWYRNRLNLLSIFSLFRNWSIVTMLKQVSFSIL